MAADDGAGGSGGALQRERTLAVVLGASEWPHYPEFTPAASFRRSALEVADYLCSPRGLDLPKANVQVRFDAFEDAPELLRGVRRFIRERREALKGYGTAATDLLLYYVGHGGFGEGDAFFLSVRTTDEDDPLGTSITAESLGRLVREAAAGLRTYLVLDCCFAASAAKVFMSGGPLGVAGVKLQDALPPQEDPAGAIGELPEYGTALLCASGPREPAKAPPDLPHTMFTGGLLEVLREGDPAAPPWLSLDDIQRLVRARLAARFRDMAVLPQVHPAQQRKGRVDLVPLFRNPARLAGKAGGGSEAAAPSAAPKTEEDVRRPTAPVTGAITPFVAEIDQVAVGQTPQLLVRNAGVDPNICRTLAPAGLAFGLGATIKEIVGSWLHKARRFQNANAKASWHNADRQSSTTRLNVTKLVADDKIVNGLSAAISRQDYKFFDCLLHAVKAAWSAHDLNALRGLTTPEMARHFAGLITDQHRRGVCNRVTELKLERINLIEAWAQRHQTYATTAMCFSMIDVTRDAAGRVVEGDPFKRCRVTELWMFARWGGESWLLAAIQQTVSPLRVNPPAVSATPVAIERADHEAFDRMLNAVQAAWSARDMGALRSLAVPEMARHFAEQIMEQQRRGVRNEVWDVRLERSDVSEAWSEGRAGYVTVAMHFSMIDVTRDAAGRVTGGDPERRTQATELWTFVRGQDGGWMLSAIQAAR